MYGEGERYYIYRERERDDWHPLSLSMYIYTHREREVLYIQREREVFINCQHGHPLSRSVYIVPLSVSVCIYTQRERESANHLSLALYIYEYTQRASTCFIVLVHIITFIFCQGHPLSLCIYMRYCQGHPLCVYVYHFLSRSPSLLCVYMRYLVLARG